MTMYWRQEESRWGERVKVNIPVHVSNDASAGIGGRIRNVSLSGALVNADVDWGLHTLVEMSIQVQATPPRVEAVKAYVSRKVDDGVGVEWCEFAPRAVKDLLRQQAIRTP
jgi:hypothetical protein